jgi:hypothetical protein
LIAPDTDGDRMPDVLEEQSGTNPRDRRSVLRIMDVGWLVPGPGVRVTWQAIVGRTYQLQKAPGPDGVWTDVGAPIVADEESESADDPDGLPTGPGPTAVGVPEGWFYRVVTPAEEGA